ncbi:MAG: SDR family NAD(P)-dependent oxidoreductase [Chloroflexota bacterium]
MPDALIWGASGALGSALVKQLNKNGWRVLAVARDESRIPDEAAFTFQFDAGDPASITAAVTLCAHETEGIDLVVYAAGGVIPSPLDKMDVENWQAVLDANLSGVYYAARSSLNLMNKNAHFMAIGAYVHKITLPRMGAYATAKAGLETLIQTLQKENRKLNITIVRPPAVDTPFWENVPFSLPESALQPNDVANAIIEHYNSGGSGELDL